MTNERREAANPYDPGEFASPRTGETITRAVHEHRRKYDAGLVAAPIAQPWSSKFILAIILTASLSFFGAFYTIGRATKSACEQRQELSRTLVTIVQRSEPRLHQFYQEGTITKEQLDAALADNAASIADLRFPPC